MQLKDLAKQAENIAVNIKEMAESEDALKIYAQKRQDALTSILGLLGNVDHSIGNGANSAKYRGDLLNSIRAIAKEATAAVETAKPESMSKFVVTFTRCPTNYNSPQSRIVEARTDENAILIVKHSLKDLGGMSDYVYEVKPYTLPPAGKIVASV